MNIYYNNFINFFKRHNLYDEEIFDYLRENSFMFDYRDDDYRPFTGCNYIIKNGYLDKINLVVPFFDNDITSLINVHEYVHGIISYNYLGKKYSIGNDAEVLPMMFEKLYILESNNPELMDYGKSLDSMISKDDFSHYLGLLYRDIMIELYNKGKSFSSLNKRAKVLTKLHKFR